MSAQGKFRVLDVGQCALDHANISAFLKGRFNVTVDRAASLEQVLHMIGFYDYDLVLVNRILDADGTEGLEVIKRLKSGGDARGIPVMLVSDRTDAQRLAIAAGAVAGFGKSRLDEPATADAVAPFLHGSDG